jgi:hypothetical protein
MVRYSAKGFQKEIDYGFYRFINDFGFLEILFKEKIFDHNV